ncbi:uncharacterized protein BKA55DRAFT_681677 [Fusarium redolens]|uniref:Uncharacterized protein n=1 Tax=Fusarium redolens TaxID=48865 RepID=A0A9P9FXE6_FUSRE|nr:uncharacterized protein BKA55DRAFT_681677 [Fusarium redolens]KAH7207891.1 hypothetical protein BKA55DRAFT_681677 [Fusarium redolens]
MPAIRRSLQAPRPDKPYLTEGHNVILKIEEALRRNKDIREAWFNKDNASCIRIAIFSCKILLLIWSIYKNPLINKDFLKCKKQKLKDLERKLCRGVQPSRRERGFFRALNGGLYNEWLKDIR